VLHRSKIFGYKAFELNVKMGTRFSADDSGTNISGATGISKERDPYLQKAG